MAKNKNSGLRDRLQIVPGQHKPHTIRNGTIFVIFIALFLYTIYTRPSVPLLSGGGQNLTADLAYGANIRPGYTPVRVHGIEVGQVTKVGRPPGGRGVRFTMNIKKHTGVHLKNDMYLSLRWKTLLGRNMYVDLHPGSPSAPPWPGGVLPRSRTSDQTELDEALEPLQTQGRSALKKLVDGLNGSTKDPQALGRAIDSVAPTIGPLAGGLEALRGTEPGRDLPFLIQRTDKTVAALDQNEGALGRVVTSGNTALAATAAERANLASTVNQAPGTFQDARRTLVRLNKTLDIIDPLAQHLRKGARKLDGSAKSATTALKAATPLLRDLRPTFHDLQPALSSLGKAATPGIQAFKPLDTTMQRTKDTFIPFLNAKNPSNLRPNYQNIGPAAGSVATALSWGDVNGAVANFQGMVTSENAFVDDPCTTNLENPTADQLVQCEVLARAFTAFLSGTKPGDIGFKNSKVPQSRIKKYFNGELKLTPHPVLPEHRLKIKKGN